MKKIFIFFIFIVLQACGAHKKCGIHIREEFNGRLADREAIDKLTICLNDCSLGSYSVNVYDANGDLMWPSEISKSHKVFRVKPAKMITRVEFGFREKSVFGGEGEYHQIEMLVTDGNVLLPLFLQ